MTEPYYKGKTVLVTGHTGFKGSWLTLWLLHMGANVVGYSLGVPTPKNNFTLCKLEKEITHYDADIRDLAKLSRVVEKHQPSVVFHLAAQSLVLPSLHSPLATYQTNVIGSVNVLEAVRRQCCVKATVMITSDKCYSNQEWSWGYRENDALGGEDPYSASKAMAELAIASYRHSFLPNVASARAGNVIGGGDFAEARLVPDCFRALIDGQTIALRNPNSVRPWLYVLEPIKGYLMLGSRLESNPNLATSFNFGPRETVGIKARELVERTISYWGSGSWQVAGEAASHKETNTLRLNWDKAAQMLSWKPAFTYDRALKETVEWWKAYAKGADMQKFAFEQVDLYNWECL